MDENERAIAVLGRFLSDMPDAIRAEDVYAVAQSGVSVEYAFALLLASLCGLDVEGRDRALFRSFLLPSVHVLDAGVYERNPYYASVRLPRARCGAFEMGEDRYKPFAAFVCGDLTEQADGRVLPRIGFFEREFVYPAVRENGRVWMTVTPNEIETMEKPLSEARGRVLTYGLGLGYFTYMASLRDEVSSVTVVERSGDAIALFKTHILPQFAHPEKIKLIQTDAFDFAARQTGGYDFVFTDLWHDPSDGVPLYKRMKSLEKTLPEAKHRYWIEDTLRYYT